LDKHKLSMHSNQLSLVLQMNICNHWQLFVWNKSMIIFNEYDYSPNANALIWDNSICLKHNAFCFGVWTLFWQLRVCTCCVHLCWFSKSSNMFCSLWFAIMILKWMFINLNFINRLKFHGTLQTSKYIYFMFSKTCKHWHYKCMFYVQTFCFLDPIDGFHKWFAQIQICV
jgi:hypothetical protein